jgi:hypothetical protein
MTDTRDPRGAASGGDHLDDRQLLLIIDGATEEQPGVAQHLRECSPCKSRLDAITRASAQFTRAARSVPSSTIDQHVRRSIVRHKRWTRAASRWAAYPMVAAATILLLASAALAAPVRQWIVRALGGDDRTAIIETIAAPLTAPLTSRDPGGMTVSFAPSDTEVAVQISNRQAAGTLELMRSGGASISARIIAGAADEEFFIAPGMLRIRNGAASRADYRVAVPSQIKVIRLRIGAAAERAVIVGPSTHESIPLAIQR